MKVKDLHPWNPSPKEAVAIQRRLFPFLNLEKLHGPVRYIAGTDISFSRGSHIIWAGTVVFSYPDMKRIEEKWIKEKTEFPYIPGLLSFREVPGVIKALKRLDTEPDLILCDGQGIAHPRGLGLASHLGLVINKPTIGCAKSRLIGEFKEPGNRKGDHSDLIFRDRVIGAVLRTRTGVKPLFISQGNMITLQESLKIVIDCCLKYRIPEPVREAHLLVNRHRREEMP